MLGKELYSSEVSFELSSEQLKSLTFFYAPLISNDALAIYQYMSLQGSSPVFEPLNNLLTSLNISVDMFEKVCDYLNEYRLLKTLKKDNQYIFVLIAPLTMKEFIKDDLLVRDFILKTSGPHYQALISGISEDSRHSDYEDISKPFEAERLQKWSENEETYLKKKQNTDTYDFNTLFNVNVFLKDINRLLFPIRLRTQENLRNIAVLADLYNISYDKMRSFLPKITKADSNKFDLDMLKYLCIKATSEYSKLEDDNYNVPCVKYLMSLQDGKEVSEYDKKIIGKLGTDYYLPISVINVLLQHCLKTCDNRLIEKYIYAIASDFHRNNIKNSVQALDRLASASSKSATKKPDELPQYDSSKNNNLSKEELDELLAMRNKQ